MINLQELNNDFLTSDTYTFGPNPLPPEYTNFEDGLDSAYIDVDNGEQSLFDETVVAPAPLFDETVEAPDAPPRRNNPAIRVSDTVKITPFVNTYSAISRNNLKVDRQVLDKINSGAMTEFFIKYNNNGASAIYQFAIAPALESNIGGAGQTPEVKPGLLFRTSNAIKTFTVPGGVPVYQVLGIEPTVFQLNGLFIGAEGNGGSTSELTPNIYTSASKLSAIASAEIFDKEVTRSNRLVEVHLYADNKGDLDNKIEIKYQCLIQNARYFLKRSDRVYYALDFYVIKNL